MIERVSSIRLLQYCILFSSLFIGSSFLTSVYASDTVDLSNVKRIRTDAEKARVTPIVTVTGQPASDIVWDSSYIPESNWYQVTADWPQTPGSDGYSVGLSKTEGADPGNTVITTLSERHFKGVSPGVWYLNVKSLEGKKWSAIRSWKIELEEDVYSIDLEPSPESGDSVLGTSTAESDAPTTEEDNKITELRRKIEALMVKFGLKSSVQETSYSLEGEEETAIQAPEERSSSFKPIQRSARSEDSSRFTCDCSKNCRELTSCTEAYFQLFKCGCVNLDPNADNIPCGKFCGPATE